MNRKTLNWQDVPFYNDFKYTRIPTALIPMEQSIEALRILKLPPYKPLAAPNLHKLMPRSTLKTHIIPMFDLKIKQMYFRDHSLNHSFYRFHRPKYGARPWLIFISPFQPQHAPLKSQPKKLLTRETQTREYKLLYYVPNHPICI